MLSQWKNACRINTFFCPLGEACFSAFVSRWLSQHKTQSRFWAVRAVGVETLRYCNSHRNVRVRWDVALCSCCSCEIRQGQFHIFTPSTAAGKFYFCWTLWRLLVCQKWIPLGKNYRLSLPFDFYTKLLNYFKIMMIYAFIGVLMCKSKDNSLVK